MAKLLFYHFRVTPGWKVKMSTNKNRKFHFELLTQWVNLFFYFRVKKKKKILSHTSS